MHQQLRQPLLYSTLDSNSVTLKRTRKGIKERSLQVAKRSLRSCRRTDTRATTLYDCLDPLNPPLNLPSLNQYSMKSHQQHQGYELQYSKINWHNILQRDQWEHQGLQSIRGQGKLSGLSQRQQRLIFFLYQL